MQKRHHSFIIVFFFHTDVLVALQLLQFLIPTDFIVLRVGINLTSVVFGSASKRMHLRFRTEFVCSHELPYLCRHLVCGGGRWSHCANLMQPKRDLKREKIRSLNDAWKGYLKTWDCWNSQRFQGLPLNPTRRRGGGLRLIVPALNP